MTSFPKIFFKLSIATLKFVLSLAFLRFLRSILSRVDLSLILYELLIEYKYNDDVRKSYISIT